MRESRGKNWKMNKRASSGEQLMVIPFLFILIVIVIGIWIGTSMFYAYGYQFKEVEATILNKKVKDCVLGNTLEDMKSNFYGKCGLNKDVIEKYGKIKICIDSSNCIEEKEEGKIVFSVGTDFVSCGLNVKANDNYPRCNESVFMKGTNKIGIVTGSSQAVRSAS